MQDGIPSSQRSGPSDAGSRLLLCGATPFGCKKCLRLRSSVRTGVSTQSWRLTGSAKVSIGVQAGQPGNCTCLAAV
jgi:hypothetical protein